MEVIFLVNMNTHEIEEMLNDYFAKNKDDFLLTIMDGCTKLLASI